MEIRTDSYHPGWVGRNAKESQNWPMAEAGPYHPKARCSPPAHSPRPWQD